MSMGKITVDRLSFAADQCVNPQDALVIQLLIEGVEIHETVYLRKNSLNYETGTLTLRSGTDIVRKQNISPKCAELFRYATQQTNYFLNNGIKQPASSTVKLKETPFVIKPSAQDFVANECMIQEIDCVILRTIYNRLRVLADIFNLPELAYATTMRPRQLTVEEVYA